ncbi:hypothetical protein GCM10010341_66330 [Streptomyces noursei]|nr:hypothetical protein GCM10010341_66330 [Streptomyces noursei]
MVRERTHEPVRDITHFVGGTHTPGTSGSYGDVYDPNTGRVQARVPLATRGETDAAIADAAEANAAWTSWSSPSASRTC